METTVVVIALVLGSLLFLWMAASSFFLFYFFYTKKLYFWFKFVCIGAFLAGGLVISSGICEFLSGLPDSWGHIDLETGRFRPFGYGAATTVAFILSGMILHAFLKCAELRHELRPHRIRERIEERKAILKKYSYNYNNAETLTQELDETREELRGLYPKSELVECAMKHGMGGIAVVIEDETVWVCSCDEYCGFLSDDDVDSIHVLKGVEKFLELRIDELQDSESGE